MGKAIIWAQFNDDDVRGSIGPLADDIVRYATDNDMTVVGECICTLNDSIDTDFDGGSEGFNIIGRDGLAAPTEDEIEEAVSQYHGFWIIELPDTAGVSSLQNVGESSLRLDVISDEHQGVFALNLFLLDEATESAFFQAWEAGTATEGNLSDPGDEDYEYEFDSIMNFYSSLKNAL